MTVTISPRTETLLTEQASRTGQDAGRLADILLQQVLEEATRDFEEACAAIAEALASDPREDISLEQYQAQFEAKRNARPRKQEAA